MAQRNASKLGWLDRMREQRRQKLERRGDSSEKTAMRHTPKPGLIDKMLKLGGVDRESRFKK